MSGTLKGVALTLVVLLIVVFLYNLFNRSTSSKSDQVVRDQMTERYYEHLKRSEKRDIEYFHKAEEQVAIIDSINKRSLKNEERFEKLLERWENQTDRMDAILQKLEKK